MQRLQPGERVGYGFTYEAAGEMTLGVAACGYADGYPRHAPSGTPVLVGGVRTRTVGLVSMDMICVDLTGNPRRRHRRAGDAVGRGPVGRRGGGLGRDAELRAAVRARAARAGARGAVMARAKSVYVCSECGASALQWFGACPACGAAGTLSETLAERASAHRYAPPVPAAAPVPLAEIETRELGRAAERHRRARPRARRRTGRGTGGAARRATRESASRPCCCNASRRLKSSSLYISGEESAEQIALRARRLALPAGRVRLLAEIQLERIVAALEAERPQVAVIDSIQTLYSEQMQSAPGSVAQVRECAAQLTRVAKRNGTAILLIGHVTKEGAIAGPRVLEHIVDTVLHFEGDPHSAFRLVRAIKNRFGAVNELGVFAMTEKGLRAVSNPSALFLSQHERAVAGSCVLATLEGTRPLLVEIQALVDTAQAPTPRRLSVGLEQNRLAMLLAVLHRHAGIATVDQDVFVNAVGGVRIAEPAADLAVSLAVVSSLTDRPIPGRVAVFGEIGLAGEVRPAPRGQERLKEAAKLGFERAIVPKANRAKPIAGLELITVERVDQAVQALREL